MTHPPALVLDGLHRQALVALRALGRSGIEVIVGESRGPTPAFGSRWCSGRAVLPDPCDNGDLLVDRVIDLCESIGAPVIIACHEGTIEALRARRAQVERVASLALASEDALSVASDKQATLAAAQRLGIDIPAGCTVNDLGSAAAAIDNLGLPIVLKPVVSWVRCGPGGYVTGPTVAVTADAALAEARRMIEGGVPVLVQQWLSGSRDAVSVFLADGVVWAKFAVRSKRMHPIIGGVSVIRETIPIPRDLGPMAEDLVRALSLEGYAEVEFRRDRDGRPFLMEINPRLNAGVEVAVRAGVNVPLLLHRWAAGMPLQPALRYRVGQRMRWLNGDVKWLAEALRRPEHPDAPGRAVALGTFFADFRCRAGYDYIDHEDIRPALLHVLRVLRMMPGRLKARIRRRLGASARARG